MSKRHPVLRLVGACKQQYRIAFICILILTVSPQIASAQLQIAQDAYAIFEQSCLICHGPDGAYKETLLIEHSALVKTDGSVVPGNPEASRLYKRMLGEGGQLMPLGGPPLPNPQIETVKNWILAGAPDWAASPITDRRFITPSEVLNTIETHLNTLPAFDRAFARYFTLTHLYNAGEAAEVLEAYRNGLSKLVNSLSWGSTVINPHPIDLEGTIFYIDLRNYEWDINDGWTKIEGAYPYHISFDAPTQTGLKAQLSRLQTEMRSNIPSVHIDWFLAQASLPPLYHDLLSLPSTDRELETRLGVDVDSNLRNAPGVRVWRAGFNNSGVSTNNRMVERHRSIHGAYWKSYDFAGSVGTQNIFNHPLNFTHDGGEVIFNLPNGLQGYYLVNAAGSRLDAAPINIVSNPAASDPTVRNGLSCFGCHTEGMKIFEDQVRPVIESTTNPAYDKEQALRLYVEQSRMDAHLQADMNRYQAALETTGGAFGDIEPISRFHEAFQGDVDAAYAAAVVGLETEALLEEIRENVGLQNAGLLVLDNPNGTMKRDAWTSSFPDIVFALIFPTAVVVPPVVTPPEQKPDAVVHIPDPNLRAAIAEALGKSPTVPITVGEMERLTRLDARNRGIRDLTGIQLAINLSELILNNNQVSDLSPIASLINLHELRLNENPLSDLSSLNSLKNLTRLWFTHTQVSDLSPLAGLIDLELLDFWETNVSDLSQIAGLINLESLAFEGDNVSDLSQIAGLINLKRIYTGWGSSISDLSPLARLTKLEEINIRAGKVSDLTPLAGLTGLKALSFDNNDISDISALAELTGLTRLGLGDNNISDISPLAGLTNLKWLVIQGNQISDISPLDGFRENITTFVWHDNPAFPEAGPSIEGPWLWVMLPNTRPSSSKDLLSEASGGTVTETEIATHGAVAGQPVGDDVWTFRTLSPTHRYNVSHMLEDSFNTSDSLYGTVSLYSPRKQETTIYVGSHNSFKVWLNGVTIYESVRYHASYGYTDFFPVTLQQGKNVLLVVVAAAYNAYFGFDPNTEYMLSTGVGYTFSPTPVHLGDTFTFNIHAENISDLAGWQFDVAFDPTALEAVDVTEGDFLKMDGSSAFFQGGTIDNAAGKIGGLSAARFSIQGASGTGVLLQVRFKAKSVGETELTLPNLQFGSTTGDSISASPPPIYITIEERLTPGDVNRDGVVSILDLILVAQQLGNRVPPDSPVDINGDGVVNIFDIVPIAQEIASASAAPIGAESVDAAMIEAWIAQARLEDDGSLAFKQGIANLEKLLASLIPEAAALLANYPNPFNPETWIPYQLAESGEVTLKIYDINGKMVRRLEVGYKAAGMYRSRSRAAYWDGRNGLGESLASGVYFYTLTAGEFSATRRMLILK